jgi:CRISPR-associated protein Csm3
MTQKMLNAITHTYTLTLQTGLHIGGSKDGLKIGGIDSSVVKHPLTGAPYIPGSSIKGKMRALLEMVKHTGDLEYDKE